MLPFQKKLSVEVFGDLKETVVIVEKAGLVAIGEDLLQSFPTARKTAQDIRFRNTVSAVPHPVFDPGKTFLGTVQADIKEADKIALLFGLRSRPFRLVTAERGFLGEADAFIQAFPDAAKGFPSTLQGRELVLCCELIHINDPAQIL